MSLIELVMFIVVLGLALTALLQVFSQATGPSADPQIRRQALAMAESLLEEIQGQPSTWCDPDDANADGAADASDCASLAEALGPEGGETRLGSARFDNVNDYHGFSMNGMVDATGSAVSGLEAYRASVQVTTAALGSLSAASGEALRITVQVTGPGGIQVSLDGYRTRSVPRATL